MKEWNQEELQRSLQERVDVKDSKYKRVDLGIPCWLLISDTRGIMSTGEINFDINRIKLKSSCFERVFLIRGIVTDYEISELQLVNT